MIPEEYLRELDSATDIVGVIGEYVSLKKAGSEYVGLCPFHNEKSPSFGVNSGKGVYLCRGCGESGNAVSFLMKTQGLSFPETVLSLAKKAGMPAPSPTTPGQWRDDSKYVRLQEVLDQAAQIYRSELVESKQAMSYLQTRGVNADMIEKFGIGYAPRNGEILRQRMKNVTERELIDAGLLYKSEYYAGKMMEWMNHRVVFPIHNASGKPIAFGGRSLVPDPKRKYINTPETLLFKKGSELFGLFQGSSEIRKNNQVIVTEGYLDVVIPSGSGVGNVVAAMGTGFGQDNLKKLFRMADSVVFCFDGDSAGQNAALRSMKIAAEVVDEKKRCKFAFLPGGLDPDEYVRNFGAEEFRDLISKSQPMSKFMVSHYVSKNDMTCAEGKASFARDAMDVIERVQAPILKALMVEDVRSIIGPNIPLPGFTPGSEAVVPTPIAVPKRSALAIFRAQNVKISSEKQTFPDCKMQTPLPPLKPAAAPSPFEAIRVDSGSLVPDETPAKIKSSARQIQFRKAPTTMIESARQIASEQVPSQAMRMLAFILRAPVIAEFDIKPNFFTGSEREIAAITQAVYLINPNNSEKKPLPQSDSLVTEMQRDGYGDLIESVLRMNEFSSKDMNVFQEAATMIERSAKKIIRSEAGKRLRFGKSN